MTSSENRGLGLFDDTASAVGNFPSSLRGYDRNAVDDYIRTLEGTTNNHRRRTSELEQQVALLENQLQEMKSGSPDTDFTELGGRASEILRLAQEQANDTTERAKGDAEQLREEARREAERIRNAANRDGQAMKTGGLAEIADVRTKMEEQGKAHAERSQAESDALLAAARRQAESIRREAEHAAESLRQQTYLDTEEQRRRVEREIADARQELAHEREAALGELRKAQEEASEASKRLLAEAVQHNEESAKRLETDIDHAAQLRTDAAANAEKVKLAAVKDAEERLAEARRQSEAIAERTHKEFAWRKEQLRRETDLLGQRKQAVLNQLASLTQLAQQTASGFPDLDDMTGFDAEEGDRTVLRPAQAPALPDDQQEQAEAEPDGDATIMAPQALYPAGTEHLQGVPEGDESEASATESTDAEPEAEHVEADETSASDATDDATDDAPKAADKKG